MKSLKDKKILIIGAGPAIIGQSGECDEGAVAACQALTEMGGSVIAVNSNPDTLMTDTALAHRTYIEPLNTDTITQIIAIEQPHAIVPLFGGRTALEITAELIKSNHPGIKEVYIWGARPETFTQVQNRMAFQSALMQIKMHTPAYATAANLEDAIVLAKEIGFPVVLRCDEPSLMPDGVLIYNQDELRDRIAPLTESTIHLALEEALWDWQEVELVILRDVQGHSVTAGEIAYMDSGVIHPGDAIGVSPMLCIAQDQRNQLIQQSKTIADHFKITGTATIRFALHQTKNEILVTAVYPRYTRAAAMVTRTAGLSVAHAAAILATGHAWTDLPETIRKQHLRRDSDLPTVAVKWPLWNFERFSTTQDHLGPQMRAVGQVVGMGSTFKEALQKAARSLNRTDFASGWPQKYDGLSLDQLKTQLGTPSSQRPFLLYQALRQGASVEELAQQTRVVPWFIRQLKELNSPDLNSAPLKPQPLAPKNANDRNIIILGSGAHTIDHGLECDYSAFHCAIALQTKGWQPVIINCNLTSITTGPCMTARQYCEPLTVEDILDVYRKENPAGVIIQFAGNEMLNLALELERCGAKILGTPLETLALLADRCAFEERIRRLAIPQPKIESVQTMDDAWQKAQYIGFPMIVRQGIANHSQTTNLIMDAAALDQYLSEIQVNPENPLILEQFLEYAIEAQADALSDGVSAHITAVLEHIELAGVHANDSACILPPYSIAPRHLETINEYTCKIAVELGIKGLFNVRFAIYRDTVYLLDATAQASRNLPLITKATGLSIAALATRLIAGDALDDLDLACRPLPCFSVRAAVFPFNVFSEEDPLLGPQMQSTGQVLALADAFGIAYFKSQQATGVSLPLAGTVLITVTDEDKASILEPVRIFKELGFTLKTTQGTLESLASHGIASKPVRKLGFGRPNLVDEIKNGQVQMLINTPSGGSQKDNSLIRKAAIGARIPNITTPASAVAAARGIAARLQGTVTIRALQDYL